MRVLATSATTTDGSNFLPDAEAPKDGDGQGNHCTHEGERSNRRHGLRHEE